MFNMDPMVIRAEVDYRAERASIRRTSAPRRRRHHALTRIGVRRTR